MPVALPPGARAKIKDGLPRPRIQDSGRRHGGRFLHIIGAA